MVKQQIEKIVYLLNNESNEIVLAENIDDILEDLRLQYRANKNNFTNKNIEILKRISEINYWINEFAEILEGKIITDIEEAFNFNEKLYKIYMNLKGLKVSLRVQKELREIEEQYPNLYQDLPEFLADKSFQKLLSKIMNNTHFFPKGHKMVLRDGKYGYFWGCSCFPNCFHTKALTSSEQARISS